MRKMPEINPCHIVPFARVHYHDGFNAFGMYFDGLGDEGRASSSQTNNKLEANKLEVVHTHGLTPKYERGSKVSLRYSPKKWQVQEIADLGLGSHSFALETHYAHGFAYLVSVVAEEGVEVSGGE